MMKLDDSEQKGFIHDERMDTEFKPLNEIEASEMLEEPELERKFSSKSQVILERKGTMIERILNMRVVEEKKREQEAQVNKSKEKFVDSRLTILGNDQFKKNLNLRRREAGGGINLFAGSFGSASGNTPMKKPINESPNRRRRGHIINLESGKFSGISLSPSNKIYGKQMTEDMDSYFQKSMGGVNKNKFFSRKLPDGPRSHYGGRGKKGILESLLGNKNGKNEEEKKKRIEKSKAKFRKCIFAIQAVHRLNNISKKVKLYGTSTNLYKLAFRKKAAVKKALFPLKNTKAQVVGMSSRSLLKRIFRSNLNDEDIHWITIRPESRGYFVWSLVLIILVIFNITFLPYKLVFKDRNTDPGILTFLLNLSLLFKLFYLLDLILSFIVGFYKSDAKGYITFVGSLKEIKRNYLSGFFTWDILSVVPIEYLILSKDRFPLLNYLLIVSPLFPVIKLLKLVKPIWTVISKSSTFKIHAPKIKVLYVIVSTLLILHFSSCLWCSLGLKRSDYPNTWIFRNDLVNETDWQIYLISFYFSFTVLTTVGYGDVTGFTNSNFSKFIFFSGSDFLHMLDAFRRCLLQFHYWYCFCLFHQYRYKGDSSLQKN